MMTGSVADSKLVPYLPSDMIGGSVPYIPGTEDEAVWNAASQACGTERMHYCYTIADNRCWYLAVPSASLASNPDSWCPLASALPGNSEYWDRETVYLYEQEGAASALRWDPETGRMQVFLGASRTILPRIQSMEANFVTINPEVARQVGWRNRMLHQEMLSRVMVRALLYSGLGVTICALIALAGSYALANIIRPNLSRAHEITNQAALDLVVKATGALQSDTYKHMVRIQELLDGLMTFGGTLVRYQIIDGGVEWEALVPRALEGNLGQLNAIAVGLDKDGRLRIKGKK